MSKKLTKDQKENIKAVVKKWNSYSTKSRSGINKLFIGATGTNVGLGLIDIALFGGSFTVLNCVSAIWLGYFTKDEFSKTEFTNSAWQLISARELYMRILLEMDKEVAKLTSEFNIIGIGRDRKIEIIKELEEISEESNALSPMFDIKSRSIPENKENKYHFHSVDLLRLVKKKNLESNLDGFLAQEKTRQNMKSLNKNGFGT